MISVNASFNKFRNQTYIGVAGIFPAGCTPFLPENLIIFFSHRPLLHIISMHVKLSISTVPNPHFCVIVGDTPHQIQPSLKKLHTIFCVALHGCTCNPCTLPHWLRLRLCNQKKLSLFNDIKTVMHFAVIYSLFCDILIHFISIIFLTLS